MSPKAKSAKGNRSPKPHFSKSHQPRTSFYGGLSKKYLNELHHPGQIHQASENVYQQEDTTYDTDGSNTNRMTNSAAGASQSANGGIGNANSKTNTAANQNNPFGDGFGKGWLGWDDWTNSFNSAAGKSKAVNSGVGNAKSKANTAANQAGGSKVPLRRRSAKGKKGGKAAKSKGKQRDPRQRGN